MNFLNFLTSGAGSNLPLIFSLQLQSSKPLTEQQSQQNCPTFIIITQSIHKLALAI